MSTPFNTFGIVGPAGSKAVAALYLPSGLTTAAGTTVAGGTVIGTATVPTSSTQVFVGLAENPATIYEASATVDGTALPDTTTQPYTLVVRKVDPATDLTSYTAIAAAFAAATAAGSVLYTRDVPRTMAGGFLKSGAWAADPLVGDGTGKVQTSNAGTGAFPLTVNVRDANSAALVGALIRVTGAQSAGPVVTDASGNALISLNAGTVTVSATAPGYAGYAPTAQVVTGGGNWQSGGTTTLSIAMAAVSITPAAQPGQTTAYLTAFDGQGNPRARVNFEFSMLAPSAAGNAYSGKSFSAMTDVNGLLQVTLRQSTQYQVNPPGGSPARFTTGTDPTFALPAELGDY